MFTPENIWVRRPGTGEIKAESYNELLGKKATIDLAIDEHVNWKDVE